MGHRRKPKRTRAETMRRGKIPKGFKVGKVLALAKRQLEEQFGHLSSIRGFGVGKKFYQSKNRFARVPRGGHKLVVHALVKQKSETPPADEKIRPEIIIPIGGGRRRRVAIDIVSLGKPLQQAASREPTVTDGIRIGRLFGFEPPPNPASPGQYEIGTAGAIALSDDDQPFAVTAGHVFVDTCGASWDRPSGNLLVRIKGHARSRPSQSLQPPSLGDPPYLTDAMTMELPGGMTTAADDCGWPRGFDGRFAGNGDTDRATKLTNDGAFVWVERDGGSRRIPVNIVGHTSDLELNDLCSQQPITYPFVWYYRFPDLTGDPNDADQLFNVTIGGDSGAGVFIPDANNPATPKLLGIHFLVTVDKKGYVVGLATPAENALERTFNSARLYWSA